MPPNSQPDLVVLAVALLTITFSPELAAILAPYTVIVFGALLGVGWGLKRRAVPDGAALFVLLLLGTALLCTMPLAIWLQKYVGPETYQWMLGPIACGIGAIGDDWPKVGQWGAKTLRRVVGKRTGTEE